MRGFAILLFAPVLFAQDPAPDRIRAAATRSIALLQKAVAGYYSEIQAALAGAGANE